MSRQCSAKAKHICSVEVIHSGWHHGRTSCVCSARQGIKCSEWRAQCDFLQRTCILENSRELGHGQEPEIWFATRVAPHLELANSCCFSFLLGLGEAAGSEQENSLCHCGTHCVIVQNYCMVCMVCLCLISRGPQDLYHCSFMFAAKESCFMHESLCLCSDGPSGCLGSLVPIVEIRRGPYGTQIVTLIQSVGGF